MLTSIDKKCFIEKKNCLRNLKQKLESFHIFLEFKTYLVRLLYKNTITVKTETVEILGKTYY